MIDSEKTLRRFGVEKLRSGPYQNGEDCRSEDLKKGIQGNRTCFLMPSPAGLIGKGARSAQEDIGMAVIRRLATGSLTLSALTMFSGIKRGAYAAS